MLLPEEDGEVLLLRQEKSQGHSLVRRRRMFSFGVLYMTSKPTLILSLKICIKSSLGYPEQQNSLAGI